MRPCLPTYSPVLALPLLFWACGGSANPPTAADAQPRADANPADAAAPDANPTDAGFADAAAPDADPADATNDAGFPADAGFEPDAGVACAYPAGAAEPMALNRVLSPYMWASAIDGLGNNFPLDLTQAHCDTDPNRDWGQSDIILFVTAPAW